MASKQATLLLKEWETAVAYWYATNGLVRHALERKDEAAVRHWTAKANDIAKLCTEARNALAACDPWHPALLKSRGYVPPKKPPRAPRAAAKGGTKNG